MRHDPLPYFQRQANLWRTRWPELASAYQHRFTHCQHDKVRGKCKKCEQTSTS